jgi:hypothetical protein
MSKMNINHEVGMRIQESFGKDGQPDPPCERYMCQHREKCKTEFLACDAFRYYVTTGRVVSPQMVWDKKRQRHIKGTAVPTRAKYQQIFVDDEAND